MAGTVSPVLGESSSRQLAPVATNGRIRPQLVAERDHQDYPLSDINGVQPGCRLATCQRISTSAHYATRTLDQSLTSGVRPNEDGTGTMG